MQPVSLHTQWDTFLLNPYFNNHDFNESKFNDLLHQSTAEVISSEEQIESNQLNHESAKAECARLKAEKKQLDDRNGSRGRRSIQEEVRFKQVLKEIKSAKMRYKRQGNRMRKTQKYALTLTTKLDTFLNSIRNPDIQHIEKNENKEQTQNTQHNQETVNMVHLRLISFCVDTLAVMHEKFASNHKNIVEIYKYLLSDKHQTLPLLQSLLKWTHSHKNACSSILDLFNINLNGNINTNSNSTNSTEQRDHRLWILYVICCAFPALYIPMSIDHLQDKEALSILCHHLLPKYPMITLQILNDRTSNTTVTSSTTSGTDSTESLVMILKICQFHPALWGTIQSEPFAQSLFNTLRSTMESTVNEADKESLFHLLCGFEPLMVNLKGIKATDSMNAINSMSTRFEGSVARTILNLDDFNRLIDHNLDITFTPNSTANGAAMLSLYDTFQRLKCSKFENLIQHQTVLQLLSALDRPFWFSVTVRLLIESPDITSHLTFFQRFKYWICSDIDLIAYFTLKRTVQSTRSISNLSKLCKSLKVTFALNSNLLAEMVPFMECIDETVISLLNQINVQLLPKNVGTLLMQYLFRSLINMQHTHLRNAVISLMLKLCEFDSRIYKEPIELSVSYILCPELKGSKIIKLKPKRIEKAQHRKILRPKIKVNPYANALLKQIDKESGPKLEALQRVLDRKRDSLKSMDRQNANDANDATNHKLNKSEKEEKSKEDVEALNVYEVCWYLLSRLSRHLIPYLTNFVRSILPGTHSSPSQSRYTESVQKQTVLIFDHDTLLLFQSYPDLLLILKLFCIHRKPAAESADAFNANNDMLVYLRSLCVSFYIQCTKYTKALKTKTEKENVAKDYDFYGAVHVLLECFYLSGKTSMRFHKMTALIYDLELDEIGKLLRHICSLSLPQQQAAPGMMAKSQPMFPQGVNDKLVVAEKRVIRQILLQNTDLMHKHCTFVASIFAASS